MDFVRKSHGVCNIEVTKPVILAGRESHRAYQNRLQEQKEAKEKKEERRGKRKTNGTIKRIGGEETGPEDKREQHGREGKDAK